MNWHLRSILLAFLFCFFVGVFWPVLCLKRWLPPASIHAKVSQRNLATILINCQNFIFISFVSSSLVVGPHKLSPVSPSLLYHLGLYLVLGLGLKRDAVAQEESLVTSVNTMLLSLTREYNAFGTRNKSFTWLVICDFILFGLYIQEEKKGKLPTGLVLQSFSFFSNISIIISFFLALLCSPSDYWELWVGGLILMTSWLQFRALMLLSTIYFSHLVVFFLFLGYTCHHFIVVSEAGRYSIHSRCSAPVHACPTCCSSFGCVYVL